MRSSASESNLDDLLLANVENQVLRIVRLIYDIRNGFDSKEMYGNVRCIAASVQALRFECVGDLPM